ncbi:hypothetical protein Bpfe_024612 [Biomphalaria pfeifferi]|uniref:Uncharacterized protein n=1 Tax=Biomphalaria pfeifferi TaxID=112525 RepID=A0AAD8B0V5_BIOPF|nr:hypothetical protein Bpfe_024612 [Biomphalaria pfeifferi]
MVVRVCVWDFVGSRVSKQFLPSALLTQPPDYNIMTAKMSRYQTYAPMFRPRNCCTDNSAADKGVTKKKNSTVST